MANNGVMLGITSASFIPDLDVRSPFEIDNPIPADENENGGKDVCSKNSASAWGQGRIDNQTDEDKMIKLTCPDDKAKTTNINKTEEYNVGYMGLSLLSWEEFAFNPRAFNELFFQESNHKITYDPDEVNVFFHGRNVMPPTMGDISENGKCWNVVVNTVNDLRQVRTWLTDRCSVFGVTLLYKEKRFAKTQRAPCLVMMDPSKGTIGDKLYTALTKAMDSAHRQRRFCVEINLNGCVERWCKRVLLTDCEVVGAKLVITNGEEYTRSNGVEDVVCCVVCLPIWALQIGIYKLHRKVTYDDFMVTFDADDLFLHGSFQDASCQRSHIFSLVTEGPIFRTRSQAQTDLKTLQDLGSLKFVCVKKYYKSESEDMSDDGAINRMMEHSTTPFSELVKKRKDKIMSKEKKNEKKHKNSKSKTDGNEADMSDSSTTAQKFRYESEPYKKNNAGLASRNTGYGNLTFTNPGFKDNELDHDLSLDPLPRIPDGKIVYYNDDDCEKEQVKNQHEAGSGSLFSSSKPISPKIKIKNNLNDNAKNKDKISDFKISYNELSESSDSESERFKPKTKQTNKNDIMAEMSKIEKELPKIDKTSKSKSVAELKADEEQKIKDKAEKEKEKNKKVEKPKVGKAITDLMKTTKGDSKADLPSKTDERYLESKRRLILAKKKDSKPTNKTKSGNAETIKNAEVNKIKEIQQSFDANLKTNLLKADEIANDSSDKLTEISTFSADDSFSTDGEEVEMIYQSDRAKESDSERPKSTSRSGIEELKKSYTNKIAENKVMNRCITPVTPYVADEPEETDTIKTIDSKAADILSVDDFVETDLDLINGENGAKSDKLSVPPLKLNKFSEASVKKAKRANSNMKYLGAGSVPQRVIRKNPNRP